MAEGALLPVRSGPVLHGKSMDANASQTWEVVQQISNGTKLGRKGSILNLHLMGRLSLADHDAIDFIIHTAPFQPTGTYFPNLIK